MFAHLWGWLAGQVWPNVVASALWAWPAFAWHHRRIRRRLDAIHRQATVAAENTTAGSAATSFEPCNQEGTVPCASS